MATSLYGPSYSGIYAKELKNIREEQKLEDIQLEEKKEGRKVIGGAMIQAGAYIGKFGKESTASKLEEAAQFVIDNKLEKFKKYKSVEGPTAPEGLFGEPLSDTKSAAWEKITDYLGVDFAGETTQLTPEYITAGIESGKGVSELGIDISQEALFPDIVEHPTSDITGPAETTYTPQTAGAYTSIKTKEGVELATATLGEKGAIAISDISETGIQKAVESSATASAASVAGKAMAGLGIATGGYQAISGFAEGDAKEGTAGLLKAGGSAMMLTPLAPVGLALTGVGTLLDFI